MSTWGLVCTLENERSLLGLSPKRDSWREKGLLYKALIFSCFYVPKAGVSLHWNLSAHMDMNEYLHVVIDTFSQLALGHAHKNRKKTKCLCVAPVVQCFYLGGNTISSIEAIIENNQKLFWDIFYSCVRLGICLGLWHESLSTHFTWPLSLWIKTTPSPAPGPLTKGGQTAVAWKPKLVTILLCCLESPPTSHCCLSTCHPLWYLPGTPVLVTLNITKLLILLKRNVLLIVIFLKFVCVNQLSSTTSLLLI